MSKLMQTETAILPHAYPMFPDKYFKPETSIPFRVADIERLEISFEGKEGKSLEIESVLVE